VLDLTGRGTLSLDEGSLWSIPVMRELFLQLGFDRTGLFDRLRARFDLRDGRVRISHIEIRSNLLDLVGRGWAGPRRTPGLRPRGALRPARTAWDG
jgi:hypothetical protein